MESEIKGRVFLVGSPRSGTTLLQSALASHSAVQTFPESHFAYNMMNTGRLKRVLKIANHEGSNANLTKFIKNCKQESLLFIISPRKSYSSHFNAFVSILDTIAVNAQKNIWIEKTPLHLHFIKQIEKYVTKAKFIHIIRDGLPVIESVYKVTKNKPEEWGGTRSLNQCIERWLLDVSIAKKYLGKKNHIFVRYEKLVENPNFEANRILNFLGIPEEPNMLENRNKIIDTYVLEVEDWKSNVNNPIKAINYKERGSILSEEEITMIESRIKSIDLNIFN